MSEDLVEYPVRCHCGAVSGRFKYKPGKVIAWDCNCSDCNMRKNTHVVVPEHNFWLTMDCPLEEATILYLWGTKTAIRRFCKTCGVLPWYRPRSNPDGVAITMHCVDWTDGGTREAPELEIKTFDGVNWEETIKSSSIKQESKV
ncbi:Centromere protein V [Seminavis robusta]|uniref:Centromere protein V n=1 Tax=Seminavis robusta TaxID=568900 RepID=A0A9N8DM38_9STRA|nr:Centromere protein V [Seminavis robusta]|eukprot:Sro217_g089840.1 Centromere protein V (144) ;mRNA; f:67910-68341